MEQWQPPLTPDFQDSDIRSPVGEEANHHDHDEDANENLQESSSQHCLGLWDQPKEGPKTQEHTKDSKSLLDSKHLLYQNQPVSEDLSCARGTEE